MPTPITGRSTIVTGASKGIGKGIAKVFAAQGAKVMVAARGAEASEATVKEIRDAGGTAEMHLCDVSDWDQVQGLVEATKAAFGGVDILCANAGIGAQDVDAAEGRLRRLDKALHLIPVGDVAKMHLGGAAGIADFFHRRLGGFRAARRDHDLGALRGENLGDTLADALGGAGDDGGAAGNGCRHYRIH